MSTRTLSEDELVRLASLAESGVMAHALAHELRQALFAARSTAELAQAGALPEGWAGVSEHIRRAEGVLAAWSPPASGAVTDHADAASAVLEAVAMIRPRAQLKAVAIDVVGLHSVPLVGSAAWLRQIVANLIANAVDASPCGSTVQVEVLRSIEASRIEVRDAGPGLSEGLLERLGEPFLTTKPPGEGTGLGLYVVRMLCGRLGLAFSVSALAQGGTVATVSWTGATRP